MAEEGSSEPPRHWRTIVYAYAFGAGLVLLLAGLLVTCHQKSLADDASKRHASRLKADGTAPAADGQPGPVAVKTGFYVDRVSALSVPDMMWNVDFYVWFRWRGATVNPGENFQVMEGEIEDNRLITRHDAGDDHYELRKVKATITKVFTIDRFPNDDHGLTLAIEDAAQGVGELVYVADTEGSSVSSRVKVPGYAVKNAALVVKDHAYKTTRGDPRLEGQPKANHSQALYQISIKRDGWGLFFKLFLTMYIAVALSMLVFFIKPTDVDARFGLTVGALFAVMANAYVIQGALPAAGGLVMADLLTGVATLTLFLTVGQSTLALTLCHRGYEELANKFDRLSLIALGVAFVIVNITIPLAAMR